MSRLSGRGEDPEESAELEVSDEGMKRGLLLRWFTVL
jgi:hypothetical protein